MDLDLDELLQSSKPPQHSSPVQQTVVTSGLVMLGQT